LPGIEHLVETTFAVTPNYAGRKFTEEEIARGAHRDFIGGAWDRDGLKQERFLIKHGLLPEHKILDVGCGPLRAGRHLIDYVNPGNYYGIDANLSLLETGYKDELTDEQRARLPIENLRANERFNADFGVQFDFAIAQSVFTHVSLNHIRLCLFRLAKVMKPGGVFFASFFEQPLSTPLDHIYKRVEGGRDYLNEQNIYWYHRRDLRWAGSFAPWKFAYVGGYNSTHGQVMVSYTRTTDEAFVQAQADKAAPRSRSSQSTPTTSMERFQAQVRRARRKAARILDPH
jgi:SAM-dependent methyltransferase